MNAPPQQRVCPEVLDRRADGIVGCCCSLGVLCAQDLERSLQVSQRACGVDDRRHGFGRSVTVPRARRATHACTSSARYTSPVRSISASVLMASLTSLCITSAPAVPASSGRVARPAGSGSMTTRFRSGSALPRRHSVTAPAAGVAGAGRRLQGHRRGAPYRGLGRQRTRMLAAVGSEADDRRDDDRHADTGMPSVCSSRDR